MTQPLTGAGESGGSGEPQRTVSIRTHGCKLNQADSDALARRFIRAGYRIVGPSQPADVCVVNTCTVTHVADRKARQALGAARRRSPQSLVVATGCYAQRASGELDGLESVDLVVGNTGKDRLVDLVAAARGGPPEPLAAGADGGSSPLPGAGVRTRAMVKIQEGCDQVCAYCIVPKVRGRERSVPPERLLRRVMDRVEEGYREVVLTGTQLGTYGFDLDGADLRSLIELLLARSGIERLRVSSLQPQEISPQLLDLWADPRLCPHFHMPLQSGSDHVLKRMRRRYTAEQYVQAVDLVRASVPRASITADVIVGFPGEDGAQHRQSLGLAQGIEFASLHVFPFSTRPGTSAAYMGPPVATETKRSRTEEFLALAQDQASAFRRRSVGDTAQVLWERARGRGGARVFTGLTDTYLKVHARRQQLSLNQVTPARLVAVEGESLLAQVLG